MRNSPHYVQGFILRPTFFLFKILYRLLIFFLLVFGFSHYWMPLIAGYKHAVEAEAGHFLNNIVSIGDMYYDYNNNEPRWVLHNIQLRDKDDASKVIKIAKLSMTLDSVESLRTLRFQPATILASGVDATISQNQLGEFHLNGLQLPIAGLSSGVGRKKPLSIQLENSTLHWVNLKNNKKLSLYDVKAKGEITAEQIIARIDAKPLPSIGKPLKISTVLKYDKNAVKPLNNLPDSAIKYWDGVVKLQGEINNPSALPIDIKKFTGIIDADLHFQLESKIVKNRPIRLSGQLRLKNAVLEQALYNTEALSSVYHQDLDNIFIEGHWSAKQTYWEAEFLLEIEKNQYKQRSKLNFSQQLTDQGFQLNASVDSIDLDHYLPLLERQQWLNNKISDWLRNLKPRGQLKDFFLYLNVDKQHPLATQLRGKGVAQNISIQAYKKIPALQNINAEFDFNRDTGSIYIHSQNNQVDYPRWFSEPIKIKQFSTHINWQKTARQWLFFLKDFSLNNADAEVQGSGQLKLDHQQTPWIDLKLSFASKRPLTNVKAYIPSFIPDGGEKWLKMAIKTAIVPQGGLQIKGNLKNFPFENRQEGEFLTWFDVKQGQLAYLPHWPILKNIEGRVSFLNTGLQAKLTSATILENKIQSANINIAHFRKNPRLVINKIHTIGELKQQVAIIQKSPLGQNINKFLQKSSFSGQSVLELAIQVPLKKGQLKKENVLVKGLLNLKEVDANFLTIKQKFSKINGEIHFDQHGLSSKKLSTQYKNEAANITISTKEDKKQIQIILQQSNYIKQLLADKLESLSAYLSGNSFYTATLSLPSYSVKFTDKDKKKPITLNIHSDLKGIRSYLPQPFNKPAQQLKNFELSWSTDLANGDLNQHYLIKYDNFLKAIVNNSDKPHFSMRFGSDPIETPLLRSSGIYIDGQLKTADLNEWKQLLIHNTAKFSKKTAPDLKLNLSIQKLFFAKTLQGKSNLSIYANTHSIHAHLKSDNMHAKIKKIQKDWNIQLSNLNIDLVTNSHQQHSINLSPKQFSSLKFNCHNCQLKSQKLNKLSFNIISQGDKAHIKSLQVFSPHYQLSAYGTWTDNKEGQQKTQLTLQTVKIPDLGSFLAKFDKNIILKGGNTHITGQLSWLAHPFAINLHNISANLAVKIQKGEFSNVNVGTAKLLRLLNRSKLSKRLRFDFSDMSKKGLLFDRITGDIQLKKGIASTKNILIESAIMLAGIKGHSNFLNYTHNQIITVIPDAKSSLPVIGLLLGGVGVGVALALVDKVTDKYERKLLDNTHVGIRYHIGGSWKEPRISNINSLSTHEEF